MLLFKRLRTLLTADSADAEEFHTADKKTEQMPPRGIDLVTAYRAYRQGARFVDVREPDEWAGGHIKHAAHHPVGDIETQPQLDVDADTPIVTYCRAGPRAARAAAALTANGYRRVEALSGGYEHWRQAGYPVAGEESHEQ